MRRPMAKEKRSAADLDAELAALEAELAALEGKAAKRAKPDAARRAKPDAAKPAKPDAARRAKAEGDNEVDEAPKKGRFSLPFPKRSKRADDEIVLAPVEPASPPVHPEGPAAPLAAPSRAESTPPAPTPSAAAAAHDLSLWREEGGAWVRVVPETPVPSVRRVLDENGNVVREEPVDAREIGSTSAVKAERGLGRLLRRK